MRAFGKNNNILILLISPTYIKLLVGTSRGKKTANSLQTDFCKCRCTALKKDNINNNLEHYILNKPRQVQLKPRNSRRSVLLALAKSRKAHLVFC